MRSLENPAAIAGAKPNAGIAASDDGVAPRAFWPEGTNPAPTDRIIRLPELGMLTGMSRAAIYAAMDPRSKSFDADFPVRRALSRRAVGFLQSEVLAWIGSRTARPAPIAKMRA